MTSEKLAQVLAEHCCTYESCGRCGPVDDLAAHQAAVVLAHLTAEGWAQGHEEWGYESMSQSLEPCIRFASSKESALGFARIGANGRAVRRRVTDWEPVEGERRG